jgi:hypothetical protein
LVREVVAVDAIAWLKLFGSGWATTTTTRMLAAR